MFQLVQRKRRDCGHKKSFQGNKCFFYLNTGNNFMGAKKCAKIYKTVHFKCVQLVVCQLNVNKAIKRKQSEKS
jgi:hypothetical protein